MNLGDRIKVIRGTVSRDKFAPLAGVSKNTLVNYETGVSSPTADFLAKLIELFPEISPEWLLNGEGEVKRREAKTYASRSEEESAFWTDILDAFTGRVSLELLRHESRIKGFEETPVESMIEWLFEFWSKSNDMEKNWLIIQFRKSFPDFNTWLEKKSEFKKVLAYWDEKHKDA